MRAKTLNRTELARAYGVSLPTVDSWTRRGCPNRRRRDGGYEFALAAVSVWRAAALADDSQANGPRNRGGRRPIPHEARGFLDGLLIGSNHMLPWLVDRVEPGPDCEHVVGVEEYKRGAGIDGDELLMRLAFGLPTLPPAPGETVGARISLPHASAWLTLFAGFVESLGGDGMAKRIAHEAQRLRGFPAGDVSSDEGEDDRSADGGETAA